MTEIGVSPGRRMAFKGMSRAATYQHPRLAVARAGSEPNV
jgi:hypothetical protein